MVINYISAVDGRVCLYSGSELMVGSNDPEILADMIRKMGLEFGYAYASSSMHFASEYGFQNDTDAFEILNKAAELAQAEVV